MSDIAMEASPVKLLIVDDSSVVRRSIERQLKMPKISTILQAGNGREAIELFMEHRPDFVTMDITMPEMDGLTALKEIRGHDPQARVAMVTALGQQQIVLEAVKSGAKDFLVKPCEGDRVLAAVSKLCA